MALQQIYHKALQQKNKWEIRFGPAQIYHKAYRSSMNGESGFGLYRVITKITAVVNRE